MSEIANLPADRYEWLRKSFSAEDLEARVSACGDTLRSADFVDPDAREQLKEAATPYDDYILLRRVLGLYPVSSLFVSLGVGRYQESAREIYSPKAPADLSQLKRYAPEISPATMTDSAEIVARAQRDPLSIPRYSPAERRTLFSAHAPIWEVETNGDDDRIGLPSWHAGQRLSVDTSIPVTFEHLSFTRFENQVLTQLNYVIWFPSRPSTGPFDILAGFLDGLNYRVTLDTDGYPLLYETMHNCGCYHKYYPSARLKPRPQTGYREPPLILAAPAMDKKARLVVSMESGTHYVRHLYPNNTTATVETVTYARSDYDDLRSLPGPDGSRRSLFDEDSLVPQSYRKERWILWPTGVLSPGAMRQWGRHAVAFVGERHFDDPYLVERIFCRSPDGRLFRRPEKWSNDASETDLTMHHFKDAYRYRWMMLAVMGVIYFLACLHRVAPTVIARDLMLEFGADATALGLMSSAYFYLYAAIQPSVGVLSDTMGPRRVITIFTLIATAGTVLFGTAVNMPMAAVGRALIGIGAGGYSSRASCSSRGGIGPRNLQG